jgi:transcriptional regulator of arginine metabolism
MVKSLSNPNEQRKRLIATLIQAGKIHSQADVVKELKAKGLTVTQATASRDLQELGAMRGKGDDGASRYVLGGTTTLTPNSQFIVSITSSGNTVVIKTPPAAAQFVASTLDLAMSAGELMTAIGTVAGDDTVLVIASTANGGPALAKKISIMLGKGK